jgi:transcriptional regulator with XRE-family HTH domain
MSPKNNIVAEEVLERKALWSGVRRGEPIQQVRRLMREKQLLNKDLAARMGITEAGVSRLLRGNQNIQIDTLYMLSDALEVPLAIDFGKEESMFTYSYDEEIVSAYFESSDLAAGGCKVFDLHSFRKYTKSTTNMEPAPSALFAECAIA